MVLKTAGGKDKIEYYPYLSGEHEPIDSQHKSESISKLCEAKGNPSRMAKVEYPENIIYHRDLVDQLNWKYKPM